MGRAAPAPATLASILLIATCSGGGTRAAALACGVLEQMRADEVQRDGKPHRLIQDVDVIRVDLAKYPIARRVAASSAYPILVTPLTIENRAGSCRYVLPSWIDENGPSAELDRRTHLGRRMLAYQVTSQIRHVHLADGDLSDNLGIRAVIDVLTTDEDLPEAQAMLGPFVRARRNPAERASQHPCGLLREASARRVAGLHGPASARPPCAGRPRVLQM